MRIVTTLLSYDHGILRTVLDVLGEMNDGERVQAAAEELPGAIDFLYNFMDRYHHGMEEKFLFPYAMERSEPLSVKIPALIAQHRTARELVGTIDASFRDQDWDGMGKFAVLLVHHMKDHIGTEEDLIFPSIDEMLGTDDDLDMNDRAQKWVEENFDVGYSHRNEEYSYRFQERASNLIRIVSKK